LAAAAALALQTGVTAVSVAVAVPATTSEVMAGEAVAAALRLTTPQDPEAQVLLSFAGRPDIDQEI
jgi:hypothetical protein